MLNSKQRATLRSIASQTDAIFQIGKGGVSEPMRKSLADALEARELVNISVLENASTAAKEAAAKEAAAKEAAAKAAEEAAAKEAEGEEESEDDSDAEHDS